MSRSLFPSTLWALTTSGIFSFLSSQALRHQRLQLRSHFPTWGICACASEEKQQQERQRVPRDIVGNQGVGEHRYLLGASADHLQTKLLVCVRTHARNHRAMSKKG